MRFMPIHMCEPGMRLGKKIYNEDGLVLLGQNVELTDSLIKRLEKMGVAFVYIHDPRTEDMVVPDIISEETRRVVLTEIRSNFRKIMDDVGHKRSKSPHPFLGKQFRSALTMLIDDLSSHKDAMMMLTNMSVKDLYLYEHSLNVCIYSSMLGMAAGYSREELMTLGLGALLHDIGKTKIPSEILLKPDPLTQEEYEIMKTHAELGYKLLKDEANIPLISAHCAYQHHERLNGTGYPRGIEGKEIHEFARWIGLVDSYDAMTSHRVYRRAMLPHQAIEVLYTCSGTLYETAQVELFRDKVAIYPLGISVTLHTGEKGVVVDINSAFPQRPIVRILEDEAGQDLTQYYEIDMSKNLNVMITNVNEM